MPSRTPMPGAVDKSVHLHPRRRRAVCARCSGALRGGVAKHPTRSPRHVPRRGTISAVRNSVDEFRRTRCRTCGTREPGRIPSETSRKIHRRASFSRQRPTSLGAPSRTSAVCPPRGAQSLRRACSEGWSTLGVRIRAHRGRGAGEPRRSAWCRCRFSVLIRAAAGAVRSLVVARSRVAHTWVRTRTAILLPTSRRRSPTQPCSSVSADSSATVSSARRNWCRRPPRATAPAPRARCRKQAPACTRIYMQYNGFVVLSCPSQHERLPTYPPPAPALGTDDPRPFQLADPTSRHQQDGQ